MANTVQNYYGAAWVDISDYVVGYSPVPYISRNRDWTLRIETWGVQIAGTLGDVRGGSYNFTIGDKFVVKSGATFLFSGEVEESYYNYSEQIYEVRIKSSLAKLQEKYISYTDFHDAFAAGTPNVQYWTDYLGFQSVQCLWALECMFVENGLTLDVPAGIGTTELFTKTSGDDWPGDVTITYADLYFDEYQLFCLGMASAVESTTNVTSYVFRPDDRERPYERVFTVAPKADHNPEVGCLDFVSEILTSLRFDIKVTGSDAYQLVAYAANYTVADADKFEYTSKVVKKKIDDIGVSRISLTEVIANPVPIDYALKGRSEYYSAVETLLSENSVGGDDKIVMMPNFTILYANTNDYSELYYEAPCLRALTDDFIYSDSSYYASLNPIALRYQAKAMDSTVETIVTNSDTTFRTVVNNYIDLEWSNSEIEQETY